MHPPMPPVVAHGSGTTVRACAACHLPTGTGHDESAYIAGLPAPYLVRQMADYKSGARKGSGMMTAIAKAISDDDVRAAAEYFASLKPRPWIRVVETDTVPKTYVGPGNKRLRLPGGGTEPIGDRIIEIPEDENVVLNRDPRLGFVAFVPKGSIAKGEALVTTGGNGKTIPCGICHGAALTGLGEVPPIAGRQANLHRPPAVEHAGRQPRRGVAAADGTGREQAFRRRHAGNRRLYGFAQPGLIHCGGVPLAANTSPAR